MKINLAKVLRFAGRLVLAAPAIIEAVGPVLKKRKRAKPVSPEVDPTRKPVAVELAQ